MQVKKCIDCISVSTAGVPLLLGELGLVQQAQFMLQGFAFRRGSVSICLAKLQPTQPVYAQGQQTRAPFSDCSIVELVCAYPPAASARAAQQELLACADLLRPLVQLEKLPDRPRGPTPTSLPSR